MDSLTQIVLGSAVAELTLGKKIGNKALLWGAICGTIPDLDVLMNPFLTDLQELGAHRGFSHSILFSCLLAPLLGFLLWFMYEKKEANWKEWTLLCFLALVTHPLLDAFTSYGTQLFLPFSNYRVAINTIFIVDPLYTLPMLFCLLAVLFINRKKPARDWVNKVGFVISHFYLLFTVANKLFIDHQFQQAFEKKEMPIQRFMSYPMPLQNILWTCIAESTNGFYVGYYSWLDKDDDIKFRYISKNDRGIDDLKKTFAIKRLYWFSSGYLVFTRKEGELYANDLRFGQTTLMGNKNGEFIFKWKIKKDKQKVEIQAEQAKFKWDPHLFDDLKDRIKGIRKDSL